MPIRAPAKLMKIAINFWPCYRGTGGRVKHLSRDYKEARVEIPLNLRTRNYVGCIFGGSIYGAVDPLYMLMLIHVLGKDYIVWDKAAQVRFRKPGRSKLTAHFKLEDEELDEIRKLCQEARSIDRTYRIELRDQSDELCAEVEKVIHIRKK